MTDNKDLAEQDLQRAESMASVLSSSTESATVKALSGIGRALLYLADTIKESAGKYEPPF